MSYTVKFLNDADFDLLPAKEIQDKVGVAYPKSGEAFVRSSGSHLVDVFTAMHELEHLKGEDLGEHYDAEHDCYYKNGFMQALMPALSMASFLIPGVGPALGGAMNSIFGPVAGALGAVPGIGGALGGAANSIGGAANALGSAYAGAGKAAQGMLGIGGSGAAAGGGGSAMSSFGVPSVSGALSASGGLPASAGLGSGVGAGSASLAPAAGLTGGGAGAGIGGSGAHGAMGDLGKSILGNFALNKGGQMFGGQQQQQQPQMPQMSNPGQTQQQMNSPNVVQTQGDGNQFGGGYASGGQNPYDPFRQKGRMEGR